MGKEMKNYITFKKVQFIQQFESRVEIFPKGVLKCETIGAGSSLLLNAKMAEGRAKYRV